MNTRAENSTESLSLRLKTPESAADAAAVASMLHALVVLIEEVKLHIDHEAEIAIRVRPFEKGSLEIPFDIIVSATGTVMFGVIPVLPDLIETIKHCFEWWKSSKGKSVEDHSPISQSTSLQITVNGGSPTFKIITAPQVQSAMNQSAVDLEKDESISGYQLIKESTGEELVNVDREEFAYFRTPDATLPENPSPERVRKVRAVLTVRSPDLQGKAKWTFVYEGNQIQASMKDSEYLQKVISRVEQFGSGDRLEVDLEIGEKFNPSISDYERNKKYSITKVYHRITPPKQKPLISDNGQ